MTDDDTSPNRSVSNPPHRNDRIRTSSKPETPKTLESNEYYYSNQQLGVDNRTKSYVIRECQPYVSGPKILELGFVDGLWTDQLLQSGFEVDVVEGSGAHVTYARSKYAHQPNIRIYQSLFESFQPERSYDTVILGDMLQYLDQPTAFLTKAKTWLTSHGVLLVTTPNKSSLHRRIGALLGMHQAGSLSDQDRRVGNKRLYDRTRLQHELTQAGLSIAKLGGCFLKPLSSSQLEDWSDELLDAFNQMGRELEDYAWFLYAVCTAER